MYASVKRVVDIAVSFGLLFLLLPLLVLIAVVILLTSGWPVFFRQERVGRLAAPFRIVKFRTMFHRPDQAGAWFTSPGDSRVTGIGRVLRRSSLDELPQLWNVLTGDMSLIGPRPDVFAQRDLYSENEWQQRTIVRPGITGLAQARNRSMASTEERKAADLEYVDRMSLRTDIEIVFLTLKQVIRQGGY